MLSVVIETRHKEDALARTLASLVGGAVEGIVREVIVCDVVSCERTHTVAEHAGCTWLADARAIDGAREARSEWLLLLEPGARLMEGWIEAVSDHAATGGGAARFTWARQSRPPLSRRLFGKRRPLAEGLVLPTRDALALARGDGTGEAIAAAMSARRLQAQILAAPA